MYSVNINGPVERNQDLSIGRQAFRVKLVNQTSLQIRCQSQDDGVSHNLNYSPVLQQRPCICLYSLIIIFSYILLTICV